MDAAQGKDRRVPSAAREDVLLAANFVSKHVQNQDEEACDCERLVETQTQFKVRGVFVVAVAKEAHETVYRDQ